MGTRSTIAIEYADGTVEAVYCHWDGYLSYNGKILQEHYSDPFKLQRLIGLGGVSSLAPEIGTKHSFDNPPKGQCNIYNRDRGEALNKARYVDFDNYTRCGDFQEYNYILRLVNGQAVWFVSEDDEDGMFVELSIAFKKEGNLS